MVEEEVRGEKQEVESLVVSIAVKRILDHRNSYKGKNYNWTWLFQCRVSPYLSWQEAWRPAGRHGTGEAADCSSSGWACTMKNDTGPGLTILKLNAHPQ